MVVCMKDILDKSMIAMCSNKEEPNEEAQGELSHHQLTTHALQLNGLLLDLRMKHVHVQGLIVPNIKIMKIFFAG